MPKVRQIDVTKRTAPVRAFVRDLCRSPKPIDLLLNGDVVGRVIAPPEGGEGQPYLDFTPAEREKGWKKIQKIQRKVAKSLKAQGLTEEDIVQEVLKDD